MSAIIIYLNICRGRRTGRKLYGVPSIVSGALSLPPRPKKNESLGNVETQSIPALRSPNDNLPMCVYLLATPWHERPTRDGLSQRDESEPDRDLVACSVGMSIYGRYE